jgi:hypothetical protein
MAATDDAEYEPLGNGESSGNLWPDSLDAGESVAGGIVGLEMNCGQYDNAIVVLDDAGDVTMLRVPSRIGGEILDANVPPGKRLKVEKSDELKSFQTDDGDEQEYHPITVGLLKGGDN